MKKQIHTVCLECGRKNDKKKKESFGTWIDTCDMCGRENTMCADAQHDFGIYNNKKELQIDKIQDLI